MTTPTIFEASRSRDDILRRVIAETDIVADLVQIVAGKCRMEYLDRARLFARKYPAQGLRNLLSNVERCLTAREARPPQSSASIPPNSGGKTHGLIALVDAAHRMRDGAKFMRQILVLFLSAILVGCIGGDATSISGNAQGGAGIDVKVYNHPVPGNILPATACGTPYGSCPMGVIIPKGSVCYCPSPYGPIWGQSY